MHNGKAGLMTGHARVNHMANESGRARAYTRTCVVSMQAVLMKAVSMVHELT